MKLTRGANSYAFHLDSSHLMAMSLGSILENAIIFLRKLSLQSLLDRRGEIKQLVFKDGLKYMDLKTFKILIRKIHCVEFKREENCKLKSSFFFPLFLRVKSIIWGSQFLCCREK